MLVMSLFLFFPKKGLSGGMSMDSCLRVLLLSAIKARSQNFSAAPRAMTMNMIK